MRKNFGRTFTFGMLLAGLTLFSGLAAADTAKSGVEIVKERIQGYQDLGPAFKNINDALKGKEPVVYVMQLFARQIRSASQMQYNWFPPGSGPQPGVKTAAKPDIWEHPADFKAAQDAFATEASTFLDVANTGDVAKMRKEIKTLGDTCAACHKKFRNDDKK